MNLLSLWKATLPVVVTLGLSLLAVSLLDASEDSFGLLPRWKKGEKLRFEMVKSRQKAQAEKVTLKTATRTDLEIEVLSASKDAFVLAWTLGETKFDDPSQAKNLLVQKMTNLLKGYRIVLELDSQAAIQGVQNWKELKEALVMQSISPAALRLQTRKWAQNSSSQRAFTIR